MKKNIVFLLFLIGSIAANAQSLAVTNLKCGYQTNPFGVESANPYLGWQLLSTQQNVLQSAYQILVSDDSLQLVKNIATVWDSKKVSSANSIQVRYAGKELKPAKAYYWKVIVYDNKGNTASSNINTWRMGLLAASDWKNAKWIAYENMPDSSVIVPASHGNGKKIWGKRADILPLFRKTFSLEKKIKNATLYISGLGHFEATINGKKVGDNFLDPGWTKYDKQALYVAFDVKPYLQKNNAIGVMLGNGFYYVPGERYRKLTGAYGFPKMICNMVIEYADGTTQNIVSDESWKTAQSPITFSSIYGGEDYDARLEQANWNGFNFSDQHWKKVVVSKGPILNAQTAEPLKILETFTPVLPKQLKDSIWVYDLLQNMSGIPQITVKGKRGDTVKIVTAELLNADGSANQKGTGGPSYYIYVLKGDGIETWQPRFTYYGFRYIQIEHAVPAAETKRNELPIVIAVKGLHTRNSAATVGSFSCSNALFNKTNKLIDWSIKSNMASVFTDCPHREKLGWLEETHLVGSSVKFEYDIATLCKKALVDMQLAQTDKGLIPEIAPEFVQFDEPFRDSPEWGSAAVILPWYLYQWYGDAQVLQDSYGMMERYVAYLHTKDSSGILKQGLGDWYDLGPKRPGVSQLTPAGLTATAIYYYDLSLLVKIAKVLGKETDVAKYQLLAASIKSAFNKAFFNASTQQYGTGSQTANAIAVYMELVEPENRVAVIDNIVKDIRSRNNALTAGDIGYRYLLKVLSEAGRGDVIFDMNNRSDVPGYGYQLANGATALTESWQALPNVSNNHFMLGHIMEWFYEGLAGISHAKDAVGFDKIVIQPQLVGDITYAKANYQSVYGIVASDWKKTDTSFQLKVLIPVNTVGTIYIPANTNSTIKVNGKPLIVDKYEKGYAIQQVGSGNYEFIVN